MKPGRVSVIVRTRNEERWVEACLKRIRFQSVDDVQVVLVDNGSSDQTVARARSVWPELIYVEIDRFIPGKALNDGIRASDGEFIVCVSSHCLPQDERWLENLQRNLCDPEVAGVYGRQVPLHFTPSHDKRDLLVTFGLDRRVQHKDPFFHNANSMIPRRVWNLFPFDEDTTNIEDRLWARQVLDAGYHIVYDPSAAVYHHHGIHQNRNEERLRNVVRIIDAEMPSFDVDVTHPFHPDNLQVAAFIPAREEPGLKVDEQAELLRATIASAREAPMVTGVFVTTNSERLAEVARGVDAEVPFFRADALAAESVDVATVLADLMSWCDEHARFFDYVVTLELTHPFRPGGLVQRCLDQARRTGMDCVIAGAPEYRPVWWLHGDDFERVDDHLHRRDERTPIQVGLPALCSVLVPDLLRRKERLPSRVAIVEVEDPRARIEVRDSSELAAVQDSEARAVQFQPSK